MGKSIIPAAAGIGGAVLGSVLLPGIGTAIGGELGAALSGAGGALAGGALGGAAGTAVGDVATGQSPTLLGEGLSAVGGAVAGPGISSGLGLSAAAPAGTAPAAAATGGAGAGVGAGGAGGASAAAAPASIAPDVGAIGPSAVPTSGIDYSAAGYGGVGGGSAAAGGSTLTAGAVPGTGGSLASGAPTDAFSVGTAPAGNFNAPSVTPGVGAVPSSTTTTAGAGGGAAGGGGTGLISGHGGFLNALTSPGPVISLGALGVDALMQPKTPSISGTESQLQSEASQLTTQGNQLQSYLQSGTLPPGVQGSLNQAAEAAKAAIRSQYAARGMSGSSAEAQDLANVDQTTATQGAQIATNLLSQGVTEANLGSELYQTILNTSLQQNQQLASAIGNFAASAAYGAPVRAATTPTA